MDTLFWLAVATVVIVLFFDYTNGFHDAANIVATIIASRAMTPAQAVVVVGIFEFLGPLLGGTAVANTIGKFVDLSTVDAHLAVLILFCGLLGAIVWNLATWWFGIPSSSSHALVGGLAGAVVAAVGADYVIWGWTPLMQDGKLIGVMKVLVSLFVSPLLGFWVGFLVFRIGRKLMAGAKPTANNTLRKLQFVSAASLQGDFVLAANT
jgi:PiT family inorganic phosphate transporter